MPAPIRNPAFPTERWIGTTCIRLWSRETPHAMRQADGFEGGCCLPFAVVPDTPDMQGEHDIFDSGQGRKQVVGLEDETDVAIAQGRQSFGIESRGRQAGDTQRACSGREDAA